MKIFNEKHIKNIVLLGSSGSGKTTLAETMVFEGGLKNRRGSVEDENTISDYHDVEHYRHNSVYTTLLHTEWRDYKINILDAPGMDDFVGEMISAVRVADTCVFVINAQQGVEVSTQNQWRYVDQFSKPALFAVNHLDHPQADFETCYDSIKENFGDSAVLMQYPVDAGEDFHTVVDLLKMVMYKFSAEGGRPQKLSIPKEEQEKANELHNALVERAAMNDDGLMERYFEVGNLTEDELREGLKIGMMKHEVFPVFCLSAKMNMGSGRMMGFIDNVAPSAVDMAPSKCVDNREVKHSPDEPTSLFVFKTQNEAYLGRMTFFKVKSGTLKSGMSLRNQETGEMEQFGKLFLVDGDQRTQVDSIVCGDIGATVKLKDTHTNQSLAEDGVNCQYLPMEFPEPIMRQAITPENEADEEKMVEALREMHEEDPTIKCTFSKELRQLILTGQGELHFNVTKWKLKKQYGIEVTYKQPKIPYRETIRNEAEATYRHKKQSGGAGQFGEVHILVRPYDPEAEVPKGFNVRGIEEEDLEWGGKLVFYNCIVGGVIDSRFIPSVKKGILEVMEQGPITKSYVRDVQVYLYDGKMHPVDSNDISFKIAGAQAFRQAFREAKPRILEPMYELEITMPEDVMGDVMTDLQSRRASILGMDSKNNFTIISANVPLSEMDSYSTALRSLTHGKASFKMKFADYQVVPSNIQEKLMQQSDEHEMA